MTATTDVVSPQRDDPAPAEQAWAVALEPLRAALLSQALADADQDRRAAEADGEAVLRAAQAESDDLLADARAQGLADGGRLLTIERARVRRETRRTLLQAQRAGYDELRRAVREAVEPMRDDAALKQRLHRLAVAELGAGATVHDHPGGGVVAQSRDRHRRLDLSLDALADRAVAALDLTPLWSR